MIDKCKFLIFIAILSISGCIKEANLSLGDLERQPVLMALFAGNDNVDSKVRLTWSTKLETAISPVPEDARVVYYIDGQPVGEAQPDSAGYCAIPRSFPQLGRAFTVEAHIPGYAPITATDTMPQWVEIYDNSFKPAGFKDEDNTIIHHATVRFRDPPNVQNYYEILFFRAGRSVDRYFTTYLQVPYEINAILKNEHDQEFEPLSFFFSDELFDGEILDFEILLRNYVEQDIIKDRSPFYVREDGQYILFRAISRNWYDYLKTYTRHRYTRLVGQGLSGGATFQDFQDLLFAPEPTPMFSNVENGLGVVAGAHTQIIKLND